MTVPASISGPAALPVVCVVKFRGGKWSCKCPALLEYVKPFPKPDPNVVHAIEAFHSRYYPDEASTSPEYPWVVHETEGVTGLEARLQGYELTWHWRMLLPSLRALETSVSSDEPIVLCVSQIRQWQLMSCFQVHWPKSLVSDVASYLRDAKKALLRPPVFGRSHRITRMEVYAAFYEPTTLQRITKALGEAKTDEFRRAHILGRHDCYFRIEKVSYNARRREYTVQMQQVTDLEPEQAPVELEGATTAVACRPYGLVYVPQFPALTKEHVAPRQLLFSSDNYCRTFEQVSCVLNDPTARTILLIAPPGSGKEDLSTILHSCRRQQGVLVTTTVAGLSEEIAAQRLFGFPKERMQYRVDSTTEGISPKRPFQGDLHDGAVFKALGGTLVIDELDKATEGVRGMLLRFLENNDVAVPGTSIVLGIPETMRSLYVFVGSMPRSAFLQLKPVDLWSRMTHIIEMQHPLELGEATERLRAAEDYLRLFWIKNVQAFFVKERLLNPSGKLYEPLRERFVEWWSFFSSRTVGEFVCAEIANTLCAQGQPVPSIRTLRGTVSRCFNLLFYALLYHKSDDSPLEQWRRDKDDPLKELSGLLGGTSFPLPNLGVSALSEVRSLIRSAASIQV